MVMELSQLKHKISLVTDLCHDVYNNKHVVNVVEQSWINKYDVSHWNRTSPYGGKVLWFCPKTDFLVSPKLILIQGLLWH